MAAPIAPTVYAPAPDYGDEEIGFLAALFDTSFEYSVTPQVIRGSYVMLMIVTGLVSVGILFIDAGPVLVRLIVGVLVFFLVLTQGRLMLESIMALHNIERVNRRQLRQLERLEAIERNTRVGDRPTS